ncbi:MAG: peptidoglycan-binding domain-containing protein, partial [Jatrophihabitantaceae bacterium]
MRAPLVPVTLALAIGLTGCAATHSSGVIAKPLDSAAAAPEQHAVVESPLAAPSESPSTSPSPLPTRPPAPTYDVKAVQQQLTALHYYVGAIDGEPGPSFHSAVMAFQKVQGIG